MKIDIIQCDFNNAEHRQKIVELTDAYMRDPMGSNAPMPVEVKKNLTDGLANHPACMILFGIVDKQYAGICTSYINFSTFKAKPYFNVHDLAVLKEFQGKGVGKKLLEKVIEIATERNYCKVTLEVRDDNHNAKGLYKKLGFKDCEPVMYYWFREIG
jgi:ribosomal protein S18 acetylase RimI-like enzyme